FRYEDYELDEMDFKLLPSPDRYEAGEEVRFEVEAKDATGNAIPTATISGGIYVRSVAQLYGDDLLVCDTLWQFDYEMGDRLVQSIVPPDSIWPSLAMLNAELQVAFQAPNGEIDRAGKRFIVDRPDWRPLLQLEGDSLWLRVVGRDASTPEVGTFTIHHQKNYHREYQRPVNTRVALPIIGQSFRWQLGEKEHVLALKNEKSDVYLSHDWRGDSLILSWSNPRRLPINWTVERPTGTNLRGTVLEGSTQTVLRVAPAARQVRLHYAYPWAGGMEEQQEVITYVKKQLQVTLKAPDRIYPGQTVEVEAQITDRKQRPVRKAAVSAVGINNQFSEQQPFRISEVRTRGRRAPFERQRYRWGGLNKVGTADLSHQWVENLSLDSQLYYRLRLPARSGHFEYAKLSSKDSLAYQTAQFAPWITKNHRALTVHYIYLDNRLVYYQPAWQATPYSIVAEPGYHKIALRTHQHEIILDSVRLEAGKRLDWSFDLNNYSHPHLKVYPKEPMMPLADAKRITKQLFYLGNNQTDGWQAEYLYHSEKHIFKIAGNKRGLVPWGLFPPNTLVTKMKPGRDTFNFRFEPNYWYQLAPHR
ncbi:MAG: hypothetical protein AAF840_14650, partial [Bacteroidota bacterium]